ncbi:hypothetical protein MMC20_004508 [Loxospora ochrophaea]|nr:hypothetical protein [Loxospora ochrophaea]
MSHHPPIPHPQPLRPSTGNQSPTLSTRPTSSAWSPEDDQQLLEARAQGMNWQPIAAKYFPAKSSNACRKRHERLVERQNSDNWDRARFEDLAKAYMECREEMWKILANRLGGEKWTVVEAKEQCMERGLKNLSTASNRRKKAFPGGPDDKRDDPDTSFDDSGFQEGDQSNEFGGDHGHPHSGSGSTYNMGGSTNPYSSGPPPSSGRSSHSTTCSVAGYELAPVSTAQSQQTLPGFKSTFDVPRFSLYNYPTSISS